MTNNKKTETIILIALFAALTFVGTTIKIPLPTGAFIHFGNAVVLLAVLLIGYWQGALAGGIGFFIFDILNGYAAEAPYFLVESFVVGGAVYVGFLLFNKNPRTVWHIVVIAILAGIAKFIMSLLKLIVTLLITGAQFQTAFTGALTQMPATVFNIFSTIVIVSLLFFPLRKAMTVIFH